MSNPRIRYTKTTRGFLPGPPGWNIGDQGEFTCRVYLDEPWGYKVWLGYDEMNEIHEAFLHDYAARLAAAEELIRRLKVNPNHETGERS